jgi:hypothetical protein
LDEIRDWKIAVAASPDGAPFQELKLAGSYPPRSTMKIFPALFDISSIEQKGGDY